MFILPTFIYEYELEESLRCRIVDPWMMVIYKVEAAEKEPSNNLV
jgi:hypothetical protein